MLTSVSPYEEQDEAGVASMFGLDEFLSEQPPTVPSDYHNETHVIRAGVKQEFDSGIDQEIVPRAEQGISSSSPQKRLHSSNAMQAQLAAAKNGKNWQDSGAKKRCVTPKSGNAVKSKGSSPNAMDSITLSDSRTGQQFVIGVQYTYLCIHCDFKSAHKYNVKRHNVTVHQPSMPDLDPMGMSSQELFFCRLCTFSSAHKYNIKRHILSTHPEQSSAVPTKSPVVQSGPSTVASSTSTMEAVPTVAGKTVTSNLTVPSVKTEPYRSYQSVPELYGTSQPVPVQNHSNPHTNYDPSFQQPNHLTHSPDEKVSQPHFDSGSNVQICNASNQMILTQQRAQRAYPSQ